MIKLNVIQEDAVRLSVSEAFVSGGGKLQAKTAAPSTEVQTIVPDDNFDALSKVIVEAITERLPYIEEHVYIHPEDWVSASAEKGSTLAFLNTYLGGNDAPANRIYLALIDNTNTSSSKGDYAFRGVWASGRTAASFSRGNGAIFIANAQATSPYSIGKDSIIRVLTIDF